MAAQFEAEREVVGTNGADASINLLPPPPPPVTTSSPAAAALGWAKKIAVAMANTDWSRVAIMWLLWYVCRCNWVVVDAQDLLTDEPSWGHGVRAARPARA
jgi:hypothetical protein